MVDTLTSPIPTTFGPNLQQFLSTALPPKKGGHILAIGEDHNLNRHIKFLRDAGQQLSDPEGNNVGTIGVEKATYVNVLFWAAKEAKLPIPKEKHAQYFEQMMVAESNPDFIENSRETARLLFQHLGQRADTQVVAFDARSTLLRNGAEDLRRDQFIIQSLGLTETIKQQLRSDEDRLNAWAKERAADQDVQARLRLFPAHGLVSNDSIVKYLWAKNEVLDMINQYPEYRDRLDRLELKGLLTSSSVETQHPSMLTAPLVNPKLLSERRAANILAAHVNPERNSLTLSGIAHMSGVRSQRYRVEGTFAEHLKHLGFNVTPAILLDTEDFRKMVGSTVESSGAVCTAQAPMNLIVWDQDVVLDVSNREASEKTIKNRNTDKNAVEVASTLVSSGTQLTCSDPKLPTVAQCAAREVQNKGSCEPPR